VSCQLPAANAACRLCAMLIWQPRSLSARSVLVRRVLVCNKVDLENERKVSSAEGKKLADEWGGIPFVECSAYKVRACLLSIPLVGVACISCARALRIVCFARRTARRRLLTCDLFAYRAAVHQLQ
jgi:hypothetical protein